jgi:hypothetical protein
MMTTTPAFLSKNYHERQLIVVVDDGLEKETSGAAAVAPSTPQDVWKRLFGSKAWKYTKIALPSLGVYEFAYEKLHAALTKSKKQLESQGIKPLLVARSEAAHLAFPVGHPRNAMIYAGHPLTPKVYFPLSHFHRFTFEHKFTEIIRLLMALGAKEIDVERVEGWGNEMLGRINVPLQAGGNEVGAKVGRHKGGTSELLFRAVLDGGVVPSVPPDLVWYPHEATWLQVAEGRFHYGLRTFSLNLRYEDDFGIDASLGAKVAGTSFDLGGKFESQKSTVWRIGGTFG